MNFTRKLLALLVVTAMLLMAFAPPAYAPSAAMFIPLIVFCACLTTLTVRRVVEQCSLPSSPFCPQLASRAPPVR